MGLEPTRSKDHQFLRLECLPIPPLRQFEQVRGIEPPFPAWKAGALTIVLHLLIKETTHSVFHRTLILNHSFSITPCNSTVLSLRSSRYISEIISHFVYRLFPTYIIFFLVSFERHIRIELTSPAWQAGTLTIVLMPLVKHTRTNRIRTGTDCRIKTFRSTVLLLQGTHPFPSCGESIPIPPHSPCLFVLLSGLEPPTFCVSDRCSKTN